MVHESRVPKYYMHFFADKVACSLHRFFFLCLGIIQSIQKGKSWPSGLEELVKPAQASVFSKRPSAQLSCPCHHHTAVSALDCETQQP